MTDVKTVNFNDSKIKEYIFSLDENYSMKYYINKLESKSIIYFQFLL